MAYLSTLSDLRTKRVVSVDRFEELDDALEDAGTLWHGAFPVQITVTNDDGEVVAERQIGTPL